MLDIDTASEEQRYKIALLFDCYGALLTDKQKQTLELYFLDDLSLSEISEFNGISRQGVRDCIKQGIRSLLSAENKLHFIEKNEKITELKEKASVLMEQTDKNEPLYQFLKEVTEI